MATTSYFLANPSTILGYLALLYVSYKAIVYIQRLFFHPLSAFPGPVICAASRVYEFYWDSFQHGRLWAKLPELHDEYGPIIRMGPDELHIRDSEYFFYLFSFKPLDKYNVGARQFGLRSAMWGTEDHKLHAQRRAAFGDSFSRGKTLKLQPLVNEKIGKGCEKVREITKKRESIDLAYLFRAITAEVSTEFMYGQHYGFFEDEQVTKGLYDRRYDALFGMINLGRFIPFWIPMILIMLRGQIRAFLGSKESMASIMSFLGFAEKMQNKLIAEQGIKEDFVPEKEYKSAASVYLHSSLPISDKSGQALTQATMAVWSGGWDTTAFALTQGSYQILQAPEVMKKLQLELQNVWPNKDQNPSMDMLDQLLYLNAVVNECLRLMHGALCRITRVNPTATEQYKNWTIPAGTRISMTLPDINLDTSIWGSDAAIFRPERWLQGQEGYFEGMDKWLVTFSRGTRVCAGQELAWMEMKFIIATMFRRFDMKIDDKAGVTDADILPWSDGVTPGAKNMVQRLPVLVKEMQ